MRTDFSKEEEEILKKKLQDYLRDELQMDLGGFEAWFLLEFIMKEVGPYFYNQGLQDAKVVMEKRLANVAESIEEDLWGIEVETELGKR